MSDKLHTNELIMETSPYLLQHAHNPVNWLAWNESSLRKAKDLNRLILVSIGYSACHWCHVMERECFENLEVAGLMNEHFICIKVDREERPDVDQIYMEAVQLMTGQGGWPLNCIALPDGRPIFGGTYFPAEDWKSTLQNLSAYWQQKPDEAKEYAEKLTEGIQKMGLFQKSNSTEIYSKAELGQIMTAWEKHIDRKNGGFGGAPKFPLPNSWTFLLRYAHYADSESIKDLTRLTLENMAWGGIYDQLGGGFSRYATDNKWMVPHFEKMLYDNAQLLGLYAEAWQASGNPLYLRIVREIHSFIKRDLSNAAGGYFSALDADSEGVEGKYYTWDAAEIRSILGSHEMVFSLYYHVKPGGNWEAKNILYRDGKDVELSERLGMDPVEMESILSRSRSRLLIERARRIPPGLDDKILCSWNALMISNLALAAKICGDSSMEHEAISQMIFLLSNLVVTGKLKRTFKVHASIDAFLDDYVFLAQALFSLYECTHEENWAILSKHWMEKAIELFYDKANGMFWYTQIGTEGLVARKQEVFDNVIPASSSAAARLLYRLSILFDKPEYEQMSREMLGAVIPQMKSYAPSFSNWSNFFLELAHGMDQIVIAGADSKKLAQEFNAHYLPFSIVIASELSSSQIPQFDGKPADRDGSTLIYVCHRKTCQKPVKTVLEAIALLN